MGAFVLLLCGTFLTTTVDFGYGLAASRQLLSKAVGEFEGTIRSDFSRQTTKSSVMYCQMLCLRDQHCMSFFHNRMTGMCQTHGVVFFNSSDGQLSPGSQYYRPVQDFCPPGLGYIYNRALDFCYKFHYLNPGDYDHAKEVCQCEDADLVVVDTKEKFHFIGWTIKASTFPINEWPGFFIGATDESYSDQDWHWPNGQQVDQTVLAWCPNEPNNRGTEHHIVIRIADDPAPACILDVGTDNKHFICERQM